MSPFFVDEEYHKTEMLDLRINKMQSFKVFDGADLFLCVSSFL